MLQATERELAKVAAMVEPGAAGGRAGLRGAATIGERLGRVINKYQMAKHFARSITDTSVSYARNEESIAKETALDGLYVLRTNVQEEQLDTAGVVLAYMGLAHAEQAFRRFKLSGLEVRPITTTPNLGRGRICCCVCWLTGCNGRCGRRWRRCSSWMRLRRPAPMKPNAKRAAKRPSMASPCTAFGHCWPTWERW